MNFIKLKNTDTEYHSVFDNAPRLNGYINVDQVYMAYDAYDWDDATYFVLKGAQRSLLTADYDNNDINDIETSNKLTDAVLRALNAKPGTGVIDLLSQQEYIDAGVNSFSWFEIMVDSSSLGGIPLRG